MPPGRRAHLAASPLDTEPRRLNNPRLDAVAIDSNGRPFSLLKVVSATLCYAKEQALTELSNAMKSPVSASQVRWVLTVPAIWTDAGKAFMRHAAVEAGLIADKDSSLLILALEPEAACLATEQDTNGFLSVGDTFMVLDCGGGTVDITTHKCTSLDPFRLQETGPPVGADWGSTRVDDAFTEFLGDLLASPVLMARLRRAPQFLDLMKAWVRSLRDRPKCERVLTPTPYRRRRSAQPPPPTPTTATCRSPSSTTSQTS